MTHGGPTIAAIPASALSAVTFNTSQPSTVSMPVTATPSLTLATAIITTTNTTAGTQDRILRPMIVAKPLDITSNITHFSAAGTQPSIPATNLTGAQPSAPATNLTKQFDSKKISNVTLVSNNVGLAGPTTAVVNTNNGIVLSKIRTETAPPSETLASTSTQLYLKQSSFTQYADRQNVKTELNVGTANAPTFQYEIGHTPMNLSTKEIQNETLDLSLKKDCAVSTSSRVQPIAHINPALLESCVGIGAIGCQDEPMDFSTSQRSTTPIPTVRVANPFEQEPVKNEHVTHYLHNQTTPVKS